MKQSDDFNTNEYDYKIQNDYYETLDKYEVFTKNPK